MNDELIILKYNIHRFDRKKQKELLLEYLNQLFGAITLEKSFDWCKSTYELGDIKNQICSVRDVELSIRQTRLKFDFLSEKSKLIVEYDEMQHFTKQRKAALEAYKTNQKLYFDKNLWINLCDELDRHMNKKKDPLRDEKRALYDSIRDIAAYENGYRLVRIFHGQLDFTMPGVCDKLEKLLIEV